VFLLVFFHYFLNGHGFSGSTLLSSGQGRRHPGARGGEALLKNTSPPLPLTNQAISFENCDKKEKNTKD